MAFVKFSRGLVSSYNSLRVKDPDTLYLVYESKEADKGKLYLGEKLISNIGNSSTQSLNDLSDVVINNELSDGMLLQYNGSTGKGIWEAVTLDDIFSDLPTNRSKLSIVSNTNDIENPQEKDIAVVDEDVYIYTNGNWKQLTDSDLKTRLSNLENQVGHAANKDNDIPATGLYKDLDDFKSSVYTKEEIASYIANLSHLKYQKVSALSDIDVTDEAAATTIYLVPKSNEDNGFDEYFVVDGVLEKIGDWTANLEGYVRTDDDRLLSEDQKDKLNAISLDENEQIVIQINQVSGLDEALQNQSLITSVQPGVFNVEEGQLQLTSIPANILSDYVTNSVFTSTVGDLSTLLDRTAPNSSLVQEINAIKSVLQWQSVDEATENDG